ncbi:MAG: N-acetyl-gamma-glutamyl-phosphate reductase, partial [Geobacteraceae bacterium]|nr:N-acetyl-gamma-glutamyl-phosphate reductase [Geobacteraceae bacterium]
MLKVAVIGATGYTGVELIRLLLRHPQVKITTLSSRQYAGEEIAHVFPSLAGHIDTVCEELDLDALTQDADVVFTAVPHKTAMDVVPDLLKRGVRVIDLSADFRLHDVAVYEQWYQAHSCPELIKAAVYGLPELYREQIKNAKLVANPGCYPTGIAVALAPLLQRNLIDPETLILDSKSGATGAGRSAKTATLFSEVNEGFKAYAVGSHRHTPEIEQVLTEVSNSCVNVNFTPHLLPVNRGILSTCYASLAAHVTSAMIDEALRNSYAQEPFVRLCPEGQLPNTAYLQGSNFVDLGWVVDTRTGRVIVVSAI